MPLLRSLFRASDFYIGASDFYIKASDFYACTYMYVDVIQDPPKKKLIVYSMADGRSM